jgi:hypothetical protein
MVSAEPDILVLDALLRKTPPCALNLNDTDFIDLMKMLYHCLAQEYLYFMTLFLESGFFRQCVSYPPLNADNKVYARNASDELLVLASDGVWDVVPNEHMIDIAKRISGGLSIRAACEALLDEALHLGSRDNMTVVLISLKK